jgi:hypothetical protein
MGAWFRSGTGGKALLNVCNWYWSLTTVRDEGDDKGQSADAITFAQEIVGSSSEVPKLAVSIKSRRASLYMEESEKHLHM